MRTLIVSMNAKFEHENPAPWYLKSACDARNGVCGTVSVLSATINDEPGRIFSAVAQAAPDVVALSCYIWNRDLQLRLCADLRTAFPKLVLVVGGPEVSYADGPDDYLCAGADYVLAGEGETRFPDLLSILACGEVPETERLASWHTIPKPISPELLVSPCCPEYLERLRGRIAYVESSRGCPYRCAYCLSSESAGMTWIPLERVYRELEQLVSAGVKVIKFVDRTFNLSEARTLAVWSHIVQYRDRGVIFHFEVAPDRLSPAQINLLAELPAGLAQIEAGIQSTHKDTLCRIGRDMDVKKALENLAQVSSAGNVHVHADLIAGLPGEGFSALSESYDSLASVHPHQLQLGFLKLLRGTRLWREADQWGYARRAYAPYEVLASEVLSPLEMLRLKEIEETVERFRNSGRFLLLLQWLSRTIPSEFSLFCALADQQKKMGMLGRAVSSDSLFQCMKAFLEALTGGKDGTGDLFCGMEASGELSGYKTGMDLLRLDWICAHRNPFLPDWLSGGEERIPIETNHIRSAYGEGDGKRAVDARALRNRYHAVYGILPEGIRLGVRRLSGAGGETRWLLLVDTKETNPVTGRPDLAAIPFQSAEAGA